MQFHYVVGFDTDMQKWFVEFDTAAYFPDGNVFDDADGWSSPTWSSSAEALDEQLVRVLGYIVDTWPEPGVVSNA